MQGEAGHINTEGTENTEVTEKALISRAPHRIVADFPKSSVLSVPSVMTNPASHLPVP